MKLEIKVLLKWMFVILSVAIWIPSVDDLEPYYSSNLEGIRALVMVIWAIIIFVNWDKVIKL